MRRQLLVALDLPTATEALALAEKLSPLGVGFKVGMELFYAEGPAIVERIQKIQSSQAAETPVFVDLKLHDIPNTVARAAKALVNQGVGFFNVHTQGGMEMMRAAKESACAVATQQGRPEPLVIGVTLLTSLSEQELNAHLKVSEPVAGYVMHLAQQAYVAGLDGVVCSAQEAAVIREVCGPDFLLVTPGIRPNGGELGDQQRVVTPTMALRNGANMLVVGRPITAAADPVAAARQILDEMAAAHV